MSPPFGYSHRTKLFLAQFLESFHFYLNDCKMNPYSPFSDSKVFSYIRKELLSVPFMPVFSCCALACFILERILCLLDQISCRDSAMTLFLCLSHLREFKIVTPHIANSSILILKDLSKGKLCP